MTQTICIKPKLFFLPLWAKCVLASTAVHIFALYLLLDHPITLYRDLPSLFTKNKPMPTEISSQGTPSIEDSIVEEFFAEFFHSPIQMVNPIQSFSSSLLTPEETTTGIVVSQMSELLKENINSIGIPSSPLTFKEPIEKNLELESEDLSISTKLAFAPSSSLPHLVKEETTTTHTPGLINSDAEVFSVLSFEPQQEFLLDQSTALTTSTTPTLLIKEEALSRPITNQPLPLVENSSPNTLSSEEDFQPFSSILPGSLAKAQLSDIDYYLPSSALFALEHKDDFTISPAFFPDEEGYVFSISVAPKKEVSHTAIKQSIYFLIDSSSYVEKHKLSVFKKSIIKAVAALEPHTHFNILFLGKNAVSFSPYNVPSSPQNIQLAEKFLEKQQGGVSTFFTSFNLLHNLRDVVHSLPDTEEMQTIILLSSGKSATALTQQQKLLQELQQNTKNKTSLFAAAVGQNNDLFSLDMLCSLCGGKLLYSDTNASFPRKLTTFLKSLQNPIARNLSIAVHPNDPKAEIALFSLPSTLYSDTPLIIMGKTSRLCDLQVVVEGQNEEGGIILHSEISFDKAPEASHALHKEWSIRQISSSYQKAIDSKNTLSEENLKEMKKNLQIVHGKAFRE